MDRCKSFIKTIASEDEKRWINKDDNVLDKSCFNE